MGESASNGTVRRYFSFPKFVSLLELQALWMCRLRNLLDQFEGTLPQKTRETMISNDLNWRETFPQPDLQQQLFTMTDRNVEDGRDLLVVNCWFLGENESLRMWNKYVGTTEGVAIRSTLSRLENAILVKQEFTTIGRVKYVDFSEYDMGTYQSHQAHERALLKQREYSFENELRIVTMNLVCPGCLNPDGSPPTQTQLSGPGMYDPNRPGLYLQVNLHTLIDIVVTAPGAAPWFHDLVCRLCKRYGIPSRVEKSELSFGHDIKDNSILT